jgi:hypothetical protein
MEIKWAKIIDDKLKTCAVGIGTDDQYYYNNGYEKMEVAKGVDGRWYISGYEPGTEIPSYKQRRINELKELLAEYDYVGVKIATGCATIEDYKDIIEMCEEYRKEIRILEGREDVGS